MMTLPQLLLRGFVMLMFFSGGAYAIDLPLPGQPHLVVEGLGEVEQIPDVVTLHLEVSATAENFSAAKKQVDIIITDAIKAAKKQGVRTEDINASQISAAPQYEWENQSRVYKGEQVDRQLQVILKEARRYNDLVEGLLAAGISRLQQVELDFSNRAELEARALKLAIDSAQQQAKTITAHLNTQVEKIYQIAPLTDGPIIMERSMAMAAMDSKRESAPLTLAKQKVQQRVRVVYLLPR